MEAQGPGNEGLNGARRRHVVLPNIRRGLTVTAIAALLAVLPAVAEGGRNPSPSRGHTAAAIRTSSPGRSSGDLQATSDSTTADSAAGARITAPRPGGHSAGTATDGRASTTDTHAPKVAGPSSTLGQTRPSPSGRNTQGGHQVPFMLKPSLTRLRSNEQALWPLETRRGTASSSFTQASTANPDAPVGNSGSPTRGIVLPRTSATSDQRNGGRPAQAPLPVITITIGRGAKSDVSGGKVGGAGFGPLGGMVDVTVPSPDLNPPEAPPVAPPSSPLVGPVSDVAVDLSGLFTTQFDGSLFATGNCNMAAGAMLFEVQTGLNVTGAQMRAWSGATTQGTSLEDLARAFASQGQPLTIRRYLSWSDFQRQVASGRSAVVQGWYGYVPKRFVLQAGFTSGHSVFVLAYSAHVFRGRGGFYVMDPLGRAGYSGEWWPSDVLRAYGWSGKPGHAGDGTNLSYLGFVALQAHRSAKRPMSAAGRPAFQNYWQTTKDAIEAALRVIIMSGHRTNIPAILGVVLFIRDPRLNLTALTAQQTHAMRWPMAGKVTVLRGFNARHRDLELAGGKDSSVLAAAAGRVIFESRGNASGTRTIWIEHGPDLFTVYSGLGKVDVKPGQWVSRGARLGSLGRSRPALLFSISVGALPTSTSGQVDPTQFLPLS